MFSYTKPYRFKIRTKEDARQFCEELVKSGSADIPDLDDRSLYHRVSVNRVTGRVLLGSAHYGKDPITAEPVLMDEHDIVNRVFALRKHINRRFFADS